MHNVKRGFLGVQRKGSSRCIKGKKNKEKGSEVCFEKARQGEARRGERNQHRTFGGIDVKEE